MPSDALSLHRSSMMQEYINRGIANVMRTNNGLGAKNVTVDAVLIAPPAAGE